MPIPLGMKYIPKTQNALQRELVQALPSERFEQPKQPIELEHEILAIFDARPPDFESVAVTFRRKERALAEIFSRLSAADSLALQRRLDMGLPGDPIAARFGRLVVERRTRLLAFLADARRRIAIDAAKPGGRRA